MTGKFREIVAPGSSRQENFANQRLEGLPSFKMSPCLSKSDNIHVQEIFMNLPIFAKFAEFSRPRKFPVLQYYNTESQITAS